MPGTISQYQVVIAGQLITHTLWNGMESNIINNGLIWSGIDDYSANDSEMQVQTDPYPASATSRPTSAQGELERLRYQIAQITGKTYWYQDPDQSTATMKTNFDAHTHSGAAGHGPQIGTAGIADGAVSTAKLGSLAITNSQINDVAASKVTGQIITSQITDANVTSAKLASSLAMATVDITTLNVNTLFNFKSFKSYPIMQVITAVTSTSTSTASSSYVTTNLTANIAPLFNTSKILIFTSGNLQNDNPGGRSYLTVYRGALDLALTVGGLALVTGLCAPSTTVVYDSPATTSVITYSVRICTNGTGNAIYPGNDAGARNTDAHMVLVEIAQ